MANEKSKADGSQLPVKKGASTPAKVKKIQSVSKNAAEFLAKMDKKKAGPGDIANALEQWLDKE